ncbi:hypothetical protein BD749_1277 [Pontibacter ramchanderi]|uniref:Uncharacterized protein n=1 Tax=Pontibacter ramchanderi TaxID=1179743 RepID=A0A2N3V3W0_9BACT|nr:hypothetical protein BD749_1277 [Pontibacter ramchanderi]
MVKNLGVLTYMPNLYLSLGYTSIIPALMFELTGISTFPIGSTSPHSKV